MSLQIKRIYEATSSEDGYRVLVDRLWPRGVSKDKAKIDLWLKEIAPSSELRTWFGHKPERFHEFARRYEAELDNNPAVKQMREIIKDHHKVTLLYAARDTENNHASVLYNYLT
ncbi:MAG TPA: DUF488 domain-containing protein [Candidatus Saccharimonadales bacterium]|nr:DUF488 domain-containing protein [Candidatus Saccharimonadales bacterium]